MGAFSVSESNVAQVAAYVAGQEEHHRVRTFAEELREFIERRGLRWQDERSPLKTATAARGAGITGLKAGVNESRYFGKLFHPHVLTQKGWHIEILAFHDCRFAFFKAPAGDGLE